MAVFWSILNGRVVYWYVTVLYVRPDRSMLYVQTPSDAGLHAERH